MYNFIENCNYQYFCVIVLGRMYLCFQNVLYQRAQIGPLHCSHLPPPLWWVQVHFYTACSPGPAIGKKDQVQHAVTSNLIPKWSIKHFLFQNDFKGCGKNTHPFVEKDVFLQTGPSRRIKCWQLELEENTHHFTAKRKGRQSDMAQFATKDRTHKHQYFSTQTHRKGRQEGNSIEINK